MSNYFPTAFFPHAHNIAEKGAYRKKPTKYFVVKRKALISTTHERESSLIL